MNLFAAEKAVIGSLAIRPSVIHELDFLSPEMFQEEIYRDIFVQFTLMKEPDPYMIAAVLSDGGRYDQETILKIMTDAVSQTISSTNARNYGRLVYDGYRLRLVSQILADFRPSVETISADLQKLRTSLDELMAGIEDGGMSLAKITEMVKDRYFKPKEQEILLFGIPDLDDACGGMDKGDLVILAARPAVGKSAFILQSMRNFSAQGRKVAYFNLEMMQEQVFERAMALASGIELSAIRRNTRFHGEEQTAYEYGVTELMKETEITVYQGAWTVAGIRSVQARKLYDVIVIDYLQLLTPDGRRSGNRTAEVGDISRGLKTIATDYGIPVIALSQLNRASETGRNKEPNMNELRESGAIEQDASIILMLWQSDKDDDAERGIKVEKARQGRRTKITTHFDGRHMEFACFKSAFKPVAEDTPFD